MSKWCQFAMVTGLAVLLAATAVPARAGSPGPSGPSGRLVIIQAVPKQALDVTIDGRTVRRATAVGDVLGPCTVSPGRHRIGFADASGGVRLASIVDVAAGSSRDIVVHLPASVGGDPVVNDYATPRRTISPGKARVLIAHTATVAPADVRVDGKVVFRNIANGEYATADLAAGEHSVALLPAGLTHDPILGPLHVDLPERHRHDGVRRGQPARALDECHRPHGARGLQRGGRPGQHRHGSGLVRSRDRRPHLRAVRTRS